MSLAGINGEGIDEKAGVPFGDSLLPIGLSPGPLPDGARDGRPSGKMGLPGVITLEGAGAVSEADLLSEGSVLGPLTSFEEMKLAGEPTVMEELEPLGMAIVGSWVTADVIKPGGAKPEGVLAVCDEFQLFGADPVEPAVSPE